jgi:hypothetical protein
VLRGDWQASLEREGLASAAAPTVGDVSPDGEPPCPACGSTAGLEAGACRECGLQLE